MTSANRFRFRWPLAVSAVLAVLLCASFGAGTQTLQVALAMDAPVFTDLGTLGGAFGAATAINAFGHVAGNSQTIEGDHHGFFWSPETGMVDIGTLGGDFSFVSDMNDAGEVIGYSTYLETGEYHAFKWSHSTGMEDLGTIGGASLSQAYSINNAGQVAGMSFPSSGNYRATLWNPDGSKVDILAAEASLVRGIGVRINEAGQVAGVASESDTFRRIGYLWSLSGGTQTFDVPGYTLPLPSDIATFDLTETGQIATFAIACHPESSNCAITLPAADRAIRWSPTGGVVELEGLGGAQRRAFSINDDGLVAGIDVVDSVLSQAVVWNSEGEVSGLGALDGNLFSYAYDINDRGEIVGTHGGATDGPFFWNVDDGTVITLGHLGFNGNAVVLNEHGQAAGSVFTGPSSSGTRAAFWQVSAPDPSPTPEEQIDDLAADVEDLVEAGTLSTGRGRALTAKLGAALGYLDAGDTEAALDALQSFVNQLNAFVAANILTAAEAQPLIDAAQALIEDIQGG